MNIVNFNEHDLQDGEIDKVVTRVKVFIFNSNDEILIGTSNSGCQLPGGHIEKNESLVNGVIREVQEETGIVLNKSEIEQPFYEINYYTKNYENTGINRLSKVLYYIVKTDKMPDLHNINLTEREKLYKFDVSFVHKNSFITYVNNFLKTTTIEINKVIAEEILLAYNELLKNI